MKLITTVAALRLVEQGKLSLAAPAIERSSRQGAPPKGLKFIFSTFNPFSGDDRSGYHGS